jgi:hypothetical protein
MAIGWVGSARRELGKSTCGGSTQVQVSAGLAKTMGVHGDTGLMDKQAGGGEGAAVDNARVWA